MEITLATKNDIDGIIALLPQIYRISPISQKAAQILEELMAADYCDVLAARQNNKVIGCVFIFYLPNPAHGAPYAFLEGMVVDKNHRGRGIGTALTQKALGFAKSRGCYKAIFTSGNDRADTHKFYEKLGFVKWGLEFRLDLA